MSSPRAQAPVRRPLLGPRNLLFLAAGTVALGAGYAILAAGHPTLAAVLLVVGYCVLFPLGIAL